MKKFLLIIHILLLVSCSIKTGSTELPINETEYSLPEIIKLGKPEIKKLRPVVLPLKVVTKGQVKPNNISKLGPPELKYLITNLKKLHIPEIATFRQPDTIFYHNDTIKSSIQKNFKNTQFVKIKKPINYKAKPKFIFLGQPERVSCRPAQKSDNSMVNLKFYNQDQGLVANAILCVASDNNGNLWVGTDGGLCKFDGKEWWIYTTKQGLTHNIIYSLLLGNDGNIYAGTLDGINIIDYKLQIIKQYTTEQGLSNNFIKCLLELGDGKIIIGTGSGLNILNVKSKYLELYENAQGLTNIDVRSILELKKGELLIGTTNGLFVLYPYHSNNKTSSNSYQFIRHYNTAHGLKHNYIRCMALDNNGEIVIGTYGSGIHVLKSNSLNLETTLASSIKIFGTKQGLISDYISCLLENKEGNLLIGTKDLGINILPHDIFSDQNNNDQSILYYGKNFGLSDNNIRGFKQMADGNILVCTYQGLNIIDIGAVNSSSNKSLKVKSYNTNHGFSNTYVRGIAEDKDGNLFLGTNGGLNVLTKNIKFSNEYASKEIKVYSKEQGLSGNVLTFLTKSLSNKFYLGTDGGGLIILDTNNNITQYGKEHGISNNVIFNALETKKGEVVIGSDGSGIDIITPSNIKIINDSCYNKIIHFDTRQGLSNDYIRSLYETKEGVLLIGTDGGGINILKKSVTMPSTNQNSEDIILHYKKYQGLSNDHVRCLVEDSKGNYLIGTDGGGLNVLNLKKGNNIIYRSEQGLPSDQVFSIIEDSLKNIWLGTGKGLCKMKYENGFYKLEMNFDQGDGFRNMDFNNNSMCLTKNGNIWAGAGQMLNEFNPYFKSDTIKPITYISSLSIMDTKIDLSMQLKEQGIFNYSESNGNTIKTTEIYDTIWAPSQDTFFANKTLSHFASDFKNKKISFETITQDFYHLPVGLKIPYSENHITIGFTCISIKLNTERIRYRFILEGHDDKWSPITEKSEADYRNIPPGNYIFKVAARSVYGVWSKPVEFAFEVLPPWYQTYWAYSSYFALLIGILYSYNTFKNKQKRKLTELIISNVEEEKKLISQELHDDLGQNLLYLKLSSDNNSELISKLIEDTRRISRNLFPHRIEDRKLKDLVENFILDTTKLSNIQFHFEIADVQINDIKTKLNLFRIIQECITNILKHSNARNARIDMSLENDKLKIEITDDGIGFNYNAAIKKNSVGLTSMQERASLINANFQIDSKPSNTKIVITLKLN